MTYWLIDRNFLFQTFTIFHKQTEEQKSSANENREFVVVRELRSNRDPFVATWVSLYNPVLYNDRLINLACVQVNSIVKLVYGIIITHCVTTGCVFSGLGYITGAGVANVAGDWRWSLRVRTFKQHLNPSMQMFVTDIFTVCCVHRSHPSWVQGDSSCWPSYAPTHPEVLLKPRERELQCRALTARTSSIFWKSKMWELILVEYYSVGGPGFIRPINILIESQRKIMIRIEK